MDFTGEKCLCNKSKTTIGQSLQKNFTSFQFGHISLGGWTDERNDLCLYFTVFPTFVPHPPSMAKLYMVYISVSVFFYFTYPVWHCHRFPFDINSAFVFYSAFRRFDMMCRRRRWSELVGSEAVAGAGAVVKAVAGGFQTPLRILIVFGHLWHYSAFETDHISCAVFGPSYFADRLLQLLFANMATSTLAKIVEKQNLVMTEEKSVH